MKKKLPRYIGLVPIVIILLILVIILSCSIQKTNKIDKPSVWKKQFEKCKTKFYVNYPDEIVRTNWHQCMEKK